jgi:hypothetical protein
MYTSNFWTIRPWKNPGGKTSAADLDFIIIEQENIEISYNKIGPAKENLSKTSSTNVRPLLQIPEPNRARRPLREPLRNCTTACVGTASPSTTALRSVGK